MRKGMKKLITGTILLASFFVTGNAMANYYYSGNVTYMLRMGDMSNSYSTVGGRFFSVSTDHAFGDLSYYLNAADNCARVEVNNSGQIIHVLGGCSGI